MSDAAQSFANCKSLTTPGLTFILQMTRSIPYPFLLSYTLYNYRKSIVLLNKWLLVSWALETVLRIASGFLDYFMPDKQVDLFLIYWIYSEINFVTFMYAMFRLKAVQIYMD